MDMKSSWKVDSEQAIVQKMYPPGVLSCQLKLINSV